MQISNGILCYSMCISPLFFFGSGGIGEGFCVPFLIRMYMRFPLIFVASILHSECMHLWAFDCAHVDEFGLHLCQGFDKFLKRRHFLGGSRGESDSMECRYE
jgi:hypothetical protein